MAYLPKLGQFLMVNVGKYTSPMDGHGFGIGFDRHIPFVGIFLDSNFGR